jgi:hypothetical protein
MPAPTHAFRGSLLRVSYGAPQVLHPEGWRPLDLGTLATKADARDAVWAWLASHGVERPAQVSP